jgi:uncharacterized protein
LIPWHISFSQTIALAITGAVVAFAGSLFTGYVPMALLLGIIGVIVSYEAFSLIRNFHKTKNKPKTGVYGNEGSGDVNAKNAKEKTKVKSHAVESLIGFTVGFLGGLVGLVLGSIRMPAMISILKLKPKIAGGTNLAFASVMGATGMIGHVLIGNLTNRSRQSVCNILIIC